MAICSTWHISKSASIFALKKELFQLPKAVSPVAAFLEVKVPGLSLQSMLVQQVQQVGNGIFPRWDEKFLEKSGDLHVFFEKIEGS